MARNLIDFQPLFKKGARAWSREISWNRTSFPGSLPRERGWAQNRNKSLLHHHFFECTLKYALGAWNPWFIPLSKMTCIASLLKWEFPPPPRPLGNFYFFRTKKREHEEFSLPVASTTIRISSYALLLSLDEFCCNNHSIRALLHSKHASLFALKMTSFLFNSYKVKVLQFLTTVKIS